jgi:hypothetical protein
LAQKKAAYELEHATFAFLRGMSSNVLPSYETPRWSSEHDDDSLQVEGLDELDSSDNVDLDDHFNASSSSFFFGQLSDDEDNEEGACIAAARLGEVATTVVDQVIAASSSAYASQQRVVPVRSEEAAPIVSDEGKALADALLEARRALDYARQFVTSPSLNDKSNVQIADSPSGVSRAQETVEVSDVPEISQKPEPDHSQQERVIDVAQRFDVNGAHARVSRERSRERRAAAEKRKQEQQKVEQEKQEAERSEAYRKELARRVALEKRALREAQRREEEERALQQAKREADAQVSREYAKSAARRAKSERLRQKAKVHECLADLVEEQRDRLMEDELKAQKLQQRCEESDWSACKAVVNRKSVPRPPRAASPAPPPPAKEDAQDHGNGPSPPSVKLPHIAPPPPRRARSQNSIHIPRRPSDWELTRLPRIVPLV